MDDTTASVHVHGTFCFLDLGYLVSIVCDLISDFWRTSSHIPILTVLYSSREDGRKYRGEWRNGMAHGRGVETYPNGTIRHEGQVS
jgi:hypothetical protein